MRPEDLLAALANGDRLPGRHVVITAHPDDETISASVLMSAISNGRLAQLTDGVPGPATLIDRAPTVALREAERLAALSAGQWQLPVIDSATTCGREAHLNLFLLLSVVRSVIADADAVWTHPYEGGHLDHDTAAWLVWAACALSPDQPLRMEFASYHSRLAKRDEFGVFWPDPSVPEVSMALDSRQRLRKHRALAEYASQASIIRKFKRLDVEVYRAAPQYDFRGVPPPSGCRWDRKGYAPTTATWRAAVKRAARDLGLEAA